MDLEEREGGEPAAGRREAEKRRILWERRGREKGTGRSGKRIPLHPPLSLLSHRVLVFPLVLGFVLLSLPAMALTSLLYLLILLYAAGSAACSPSQPSGERALCPREEELAFLYSAVGSQCPVWIETSLPLEVTGESLDKLRRARNGGGKTLYAVLLHASWCPFSRAARPAFAALSAMFPHITHLAVEESAAMPSLLSRLGVHSFPAILLVNGTTVARHRGPKDLPSLAAFYERISGTRAEVDLAVDFAGQRQMSRRPPPPREPYMAFSLVFLSLRAFVFFFPGILSRLRAFLRLYARRVKEAILAEWNQIWGRARQMVEMRKLCSQLCLRNKNLRRRADDARAWASSLTSVSSSS